ncbi:MAG: hypothetical protein Q4G43_09255 [Mobilicoccus sp.]|nr:hypothetical protein [Mobilicoccus sp.]
MSATDHLSADLDLTLDRPAHTTLDYLAVDIGERGLRARRAGADEGRIDIGDLHDGLGALDLVAAVSSLAGDGPPPVTVWTLGGAAASIDPSELIAVAPPQTRTVVVDAATATLVGALGGVEPGVVLEMTAGVRTICTDFETLWHRIDGWGPILGDRGSGAWLGAQGLAAGLRHRDGVPGGSEHLLQAGRRAFGDESGWARILEEHPVAEVLADFAHVVGDVSRHDPVAEGLCRLAGEHLADAICAGAQLLPGRPLTATGPLLLVDAVKVSFASALGKRRIILVPALGDTLAGTRHIAEHVLAGGRLTHHPPHVYVQGQNALAAPKP